MAKSMVLAIVAIMGVGLVPAPQGTAYLKCGTGVLDLLSGIDVIYVTRNGYIPDGFIGASAVVWDWTDYECLFPETDVAAATALTPPGILDMPSDAIADMLADPTIADEVPDFGFSSVDTCILDSCGPIICSDCIYVAEADRATPSNGVIELYSVYSNSLNRPEGECNEAAVNRAASVLSGATGVTVQGICAVNVDPLRWTWNCDRNACVDDDDICNSLTAFTAGKLQDHQVVLGWVHEATTIGSDCASSNTAYAAEVRDPGGAYPKHSVAVHEVAHLFGADHWPCDTASSCGWKRYICRQVHWGHWGHQIHSFRSVMNYCHMKWGVVDFDPVNLARIRMV